MSLSPEKEIKLKVGSRVRLKRGAVVHSTNQRLQRREVLRPYWVEVEQLDASARTVSWIGSAKYLNTSSMDNIDSVEDLG